MPAVVAGEALMDLVPDARGVVRAHGGGGPFTVARTMARLGAPVQFLGRLSTDAHGVALRAALAADGVGLATAVATDDPTTLAEVILDADGAATYRFAIDGTSAPGLTAADVARVRPSDMEVLCVGTLGLVFAPCAATLERLVADVDDTVLVALDPNVRPAAIAHGAALRARLQRIAVRADLIKASADDLAWLQPGTDPVTAMRALLEVDRGARVGIVTLGADGAVVVPAAGAPIAVAVPAVTVVDTIGAGDAFLGALLAWWHHEGLTRSDLTDATHVVAATRFACRVAALTCARAGGDPPRRDDL